MRLRLFVAMWIAVAAVVGVTVVAADRFDFGGSAGDQVIDVPASGPGGVNGGSATGSDRGAAPGEGDGSEALAPGQTRLAGTVTTIHLEGAVLDPREAATPLRITSDRGFGNGGELTGVQVDGEAASIVWDGGRPFVLDGGALVLGPVTVDLGAEGLRLALAGVHGLVPGTYRLDTPVAVGATGMATARDAVTFTTGEDARFAATGDTALTLAADRARRFTGPGLVRLEGSLELTDAAGTSAAPSFEAGAAAYDLTFTPDGAGAWTVSGLVDLHGAG